jgi:hypothetical protein
VDAGCLDALDLADLEVHEVEHGPDQQPTGLVAADTEDVERPGASVVGPLGRNLSSSVF